MDDHEKLDWAMSTNSAAWFVNWVCVLIMFCGLVMVANSVERIRLMENEHRKMARQELADMTNAINVRAELAKSIERLEKEIGAIHKETTVANELDQKSWEQAQARDVQLMGAIDILRNRLARVSSSVNKTEASR